MAFFKASKNEADVKTASSNHITGSGHYEVTILAPVVDTSKGGSVTINPFVSHNGQEQIIYGGLRISNNDGSDNAIGNRLLNQLLVVTGVDSLEDPVEMELPIGKKGAAKVVAVLEDLMDVDATMRIQVAYNLYNGNIQENRNIRSFFRTGDNASAAEVVSGENIGEDFKRDLKYADNISYDDGLTAENITAWVADGRTGNGGAGGTTTAKAPSFGKKRFGKDKED